MRIQRVKINNKINHVFDYDINCNYVEKFIINAPTSENISILEFHSDPDGSLIVDSDKGKEKYSLKSLDLSRENGQKEDGQEVRSYYLAIEFTKFSNGENVTQTKETKEWNLFNKPNKPKTTHQGENISAKIDGEVAVEYKKSLKNSIDFAASILPKGPLKLLIEFKLPINGTFLDRTITRKIELYIAPQEMIYDVILDFGSEATQMACYSRGESATTAGFVKLFPNIRKRYQKEEDEGQLKDEDFYQYDISNKEFYRSYFMLKNQASIEILNNIQDNINDKSGGELFKVLTSKSFVEKEENKSGYIVTPNVKISCFGGQEMPQIEVDGDHTCINSLGGRDSHLLYRLGILPFLYEAINGIVLKSKDKNFISFHILMPNVYLQVEISKILQLLQKDIEKLLSSEERFGVIWGFDITAVSESDASIIGACELMRSQHANEQLPEGKYLLLDAGKGTLDLSLTEYKFDEKENCYKYNNLWRSGIIGAGNSLSYAFMFELVHKYLEGNAQLNGGVEESDVVSYIKNNILNVTTDGRSINADPYYLLKLMRLVDSFKIYHKEVCEGENINDNKDDKLPLKDLTLAGFVDNWLTKQIDESNKCVKLNIEDGNSVYIKRMINSIVNEVMNSLKDMSILFEDNNKPCVDYVIFSGRAFELAEFKNTMYNSLKGRYEEIKEKTFIQANQATSMKNICLLCSQPLVNGNYSRKINSSVKLIDVKQQKESDFLDKLLIYSKGRLPGWIYKLSSIIISRRAKKDGSSDNGEIVLESNNKPFSLNSLRNPIKNGELFGRDADPNTINGHSDAQKGYGLKIENPNSALINIGGVRFPFSNTNIKLDSDKKVDVLFNGEYHILRSKHGTKELKRQDINMAVSPFMISSFFPNCTVNDNMDFTIPQIKPLWEEEPHDENRDSISESTKEHDNDRKTGPAVINKKKDESGDEGEELNKLVKN